MSECKVNTKLYNTLIKVYDLINGPWDDPVISEELYDEIGDILNEYNIKHANIKKNLNDL